MFKLRGESILAFLGVLSLCVLVQGKDKDPEAYLRINTVQDDRGNYAETSDPDRYYFVEIYMPVPLEKRAYDQLSGASGSGNLAKVGAIVQGQKELPHPIQVSPDDCVKDNGGETQCSRKHFRIYLPSSLDTSKSYSVFFDSYKVDTGEVLRFRNIGVSLDYGVSLTRDDPDPSCTRFITLNISYEDEEKAFIPPAEPPLKFSTLQDKNTYNAYITGRLTRLFKWIDGLRGDQLNQIQVRVRPLNTIIKPPASVGATEVAPGHFELANGETWQPTEADLPKLSLVRFKPNGLNAARAVSNKFVSACLITETGLPRENFNIKITLRQPGVPPELMWPLVRTGISATLTSVAPDPRPDAGAVGERAIDKDLDVGLAFSSSVENVETAHVDPLITDPVTVRERKTRATLDLRVAPFGTRPSINLLTAPGLGNSSTTRTSALFRLITPFFVDAKVSTGKIDKDTLSLNRVVLGSQLEYRYVYRNATFPTYYRFIGRFSNASDRDFKQAEYKGTFEFRPVFSFLNHPQASMQAAQSQVIIDNSNKASPLTIISFEEGGYEIVPFLGGEFGRTWSRRNPAAVIEPSDTVKRLYLGIDIILSPFRRTTLSLTDTFYFKFDSTTKRRANYFSGNLDFLLGRFFGRDKAGHSVFLSFERGQKPPFDGPGVNAVKLGYRIQAGRVFSPLGVR